MLDFEKEVPKDLTALLEKMPADMSKEHGVSENVIKLAAVSSLAWFMASLSIAEDREKWMIKFQDDLKRIGMKSLINEFMKRISSEEGAKDFMDKMEKKFKDEG